MTDRGIEQASWFASLLQLCGKYELVNSIEPNPKFENIDQIAASARKKGFDCVIGIGGGSVLDAAKAISMLLSNPGSICDYEGKNRFSNPAVPFIAIPTTCGTGSEVTWVSVISVPNQGRKISVKGDHMFPRFALVDAELLASLPSHLVASTGMDAMTHAIEAVVGRPANPASNALALQAIRTIKTYLPFAARAEDSSENPGAPTRNQALEHVMTASTLAGLAFGNADVGAVHCLSESIGGVLDLPHGLLNTLLLVPVLRYQQSAIQEQLGLISNALETDQAHLFSELDRLIAKLPLPSWNELNIPPHTFEDLAQKSESNGSNPSNRFEMKAHDYLTILQSL